MITKFLPLPADSGGKQRSLAILRRLAGLGEVTLCAFDDGRADHRALADLGVEVRTTTWSPKPWSALRAGSVTVGRFRDDALDQAVGAEARARPPDLLQVEYLQMAQYAHGTDAPLRVIDLHNIESGLLASQGRSRRPPAAAAMRVEAALLGLHERRARHRFDVVTVVSDEDAAHLPGQGGEILVCPNGVNPTARLAPSEAPVVVFVALLGWAPNADAAVWLARDIWPLVRRRVPAATLRLVGRDPGAEVRRLEQPGVHVTGSVADVTPHLHDARVAVAPLRAGGGTRLKILEALAVGRPVVSTTLGAEGLGDLVGDGLVLADGAAGFADALVDLLVDPRRCAELGQLGHDAVHRRYVWDKTLAPLVDRITALPRA
ncbi:MAG: glycosyltransferase family 4 protein [Actinomycetota bacterium]|nr:glycosyltransferase family 4 protein [Actinomycetota bacterium]